MREQQDLNLCQYKTIQNKTNKKQIKAEQIQSNLNFNYITIYIKQIRHQLIDKLPYYKYKYALHFPWQVLMQEAIPDDKQKQKQKEKQKKPIAVFLEAVKKHVEYLNKLNDEVIRKLMHPDYPIKSIITFYQKQLMPKLTARLNSKSPKFSYIYSDILIWYAHRFVGLVYLIDMYVKKLDAKVRKQPFQVPNRNSTVQLTKTNSMSAKQSFSHSNSPSQQPSQETLPMDTSLETLLRIPQQFLAKTVPSMIKSAIAYCQSQSKSSQQHRYIQEASSLQLFLTIFQKYLRQIEETTQYNQSSPSVETMQEQVKMSFFSNVHPKRKIVVKFGYRFLFLAKLRMRLKKANKHIEQRKFRIHELIEGQRKYTEGLKDYIEYIKKPIQASGLITKDQQKILFSTIQPILALHTHFYKQLSQRYANYSKYQTYGDILVKNFPFFKIYNDYIYNANQAQALLLKLAQDHVEVDQMCKKFMNQKQKKASDELKQPTFRIARYEMIIKEILKNTNPIHPDYDKLNEAQKVGVSMLKKVNENVDATCRRNKLNELQQEFGTEERPIYIDKRQFLQQFQMIYIHEDKQEQVIVYVFNDIVIIVHNDLRKILKWIKIDENFYVRKQDDNKTYKNVIKIHSDGFTTLSAGSEEKHFNKAQTFFNLLQRVSKQNEQSNKMVYVQAIGTEEIGSTSFAKHTQYVVEIKYLGLRKFVYLRFSQMQPLVKKVQQHYQNDLNISHEQALKKNWFNNHKSKTIQDRKRTIQQILQKMLNHELVKNDPVFILEQLKLDTNFIKKTQQYKKKKQFSIGNASDMKQKLDQKQNNVKSSMLQHAQSMQCMSTQSFIKPKKKQYKQAETILCATEIKLGRDRFHDPDDVLLDPKKTQAEKVPIKIHTMVEDDPCIVSITEFYTVQDVCHKVSKMIGLRMNRDFRLFHEIGKKQLRVLDQQQKLMSLFNFPKIEGKGLVTDIFDSLKKIVAPSSHPKLIFKKYYFLPIQIQQSQCRKDLTRLRLIVYQIFSSIKEMRYQLGFDEYLLFLAMLIYIEYDGEPPQKISDSYVDRIIPQTIFKLKNYTQQQWIEKCRPHLIRLSEQINKIILYNRQKLRENKIKADSVSKTALHFGHRHLCSQIVINKIKSNVIFGANLFYVQPYKNTFQKLSNEGRKMAYNMWLAIKVEGLNLLTPSSKQTVFELDYKNIQKIFVFSESITFKMQGLSTLEYRFNTYQSFQISQLVKYNKCLNDTLLELERNQDLIVKARMYKQESLIYRNTYDRSEHSSSNKSQFSN